MAQGGPEQVPGWLMRPMGGAGQPMGHLDLRFPMFLPHLSIWTCVFQCFGALGRSRCTPVQPNRPGASKGTPSPRGILGGFGPRAGTFKEGYRYLYC